jgi:hypothetical protein
LPVKSGAGYGKLVNRCLRNLAIISMLVSLA